MTTGTFETQPTLPSGPAIPPGGGGVLETQPTTPSNKTIPPAGGGGTFEAQQIPSSNTTTPQGGGGTFEAQQAPVTPGDTAAPKIAGGFNTLPQPPTDEGTQAPTLTEETAPICPEGQVLDEQTNLCVPEEPGVSEEELEESEQQSSEERGDS
jgi:hypothetical protein